MRRVCLIPALWAAALLAADAPWPTWGWPVSTPERQGLDPAVLDQGDAWIRANSANRYSFLVVRNGYLVYERYYNGAGPSSARHIASISKSILSALTGIAIEQGRLSLEDKFFDTFPEYAGVVQDFRTTELRLRDMLTMTVGLDWTDDDIRWRWYAAPALYPDWILYTLTRPAHAAPGERFWYNTGNTHMLSALLTRKTGLTTYEFARRNLLDPLGISMGDWWRDFSPYRYYTGGFGMHITARDLAKFGYLYLRDGVWEGRRLLASGWVRDSVAPQVRHNAGADDFYGYLWWMDNLHGFFVPGARGMGSQRIWYSRDLDLLVVSTGNYEGTTPDTTPLVRDYVVPSAFQGAPAVSAVVNAAGGAPSVSPDSFATVYGSNLSPAAVTWDPVILDGKTLPSELGGVKVKIGGKRAWLSYAGPSQVNVLVPPDVPAGIAEVEVSHPAGTTKTAVTVAPVSPALFGYELGGRIWASAVFANEAVYVADPGVFPDVASRPARRGDILSLYATGLGATAEPHPGGEVLKRAYVHAAPESVAVYFGEARAEVLGVYMTFAGVWQVNVTAPETAPAGDVPVTIQVGGERSPVALLRIVEN